MPVSTSRSKIDTTLGVGSLQRWVSVRQKIWTEWQNRGEPDMVQTLRRHPEFLYQKSLVMELAIDEYESRCKTSDVSDITGYCSRFREFGNTLCNSIHHALEVHRRFTKDIPWPNIGHDVGGFQVIEQLGAGASARVYLCLEKDLGFRQVAVKISPHASFEASILGRLVHPSITPLYSAGVIEESDLNFLCMPFAGRSTLADLVEVAFKSGYPQTDASILEAAHRWSATDEESQTQSAKPRRPLRTGTYVDAVLQLSIQIADALTLAHDEHILHGDLKPSNVLLTPSGQPMLLDFNLSRDFSKARRTFGGTLPYMPPEHLRVLTSNSEDTYEPEITAASDVYSFGAPVYELLAGRAPITSSSLCDEPSIAAANAIIELERGVPDIQKFNPLVHRRLSALISECMALDPACRPKSMRAVKAALQAERRSVATLIRRARVHPALFSLVVGIPMVTLGVGLTYAASRPPSHLRYYQEGINLVASKRPNDAAKYFASAIEADPSYAPARFELARAKLAMGDIDLAMADFGLLARRDSDVTSVSYLAYCFNLKHAHTLAIPLYERAIRNGCTSASVYNNLAASYLDGASNLSPRERMERVEANLAEAYKWEPSSSSVNLNYIRVAIRRADQEADFEPISSWCYAKALLSEAPGNEYARLQIGLWWNCVCKRASVDPARGDFRKLLDATNGLDDRTANEIAAVYDATNLSSNSGAPSITSAQAVLSSISACYVEPR